MPTLDASWSPQIRQIGELERRDHWYLTADHRCFFFGEYTARAGFGHSSTNQIITNIKKKPSVRGTPQWDYKRKDMLRVAAAIRGAINATHLDIVTLVPIPPSKLPDHADYDPRMAEIARFVGPKVDVRDLIVPTASREPAHESENRIRPDELRATLTLREDLCARPPTEILLIDDVITTGCSFVACSALLAERFPGVPISGIFAARRVVDHMSDFGVIELL